MTAGLEVNTRIAGAEIKQFETVKEAPHGTVIPIKKLWNAQKLIALMDYHGYSIKFLAQKVDVNFVTVWRWRKGITIPSGHYRRILHRIFGVDL